MQLSPPQSQRELDAESLRSGDRCAGKGAWDAVVVLAFGTGISNAFLARKAAKYSATLHCPMICQKEVLGYLNADDRSTKALALRGTEGIYLDTYRALVEMKAICEQRGWSKILLVVHPDHQSRATKVAHKLGLDVEVADIEKVPYDRSSSQWWTRNRLLFKVWDLGAGVYYFIRGFV